MSFEEKAKGSKIIELIEKTLKETDDFKEI
jgi:hypothetical protein